MGKKIELKRVNNAIAEVINKFFNIYDTLKWVKPKNRFNTDEVGIIEGVRCNGLVVKSRKHAPGSFYVKESYKRT